jgi:hypothetical protein
MQLGRGEFRIFFVEETLDALITERGAVPYPTIGG